MNPTQELIAGGALAALVALGGLAGWRRRARRVAETIAYLRGVHFVLSDAPEAAIGELTRAVALNPNAAASSIETYFALGKLFRRKGDLERAMRLHQNILLQPGLPLSVKREAQLELAIDLHKAGLLTQAAAAYESFLAEEPTHAEALVQLRRVHQAAHAPEKAAEVARRAVQAGQGGEAILAHLLAAAARASLPRDPAHAATLADRAVEAFPSGSDGPLARAEVALARGEAAQAASGLIALLAAAPEEALAIEPLLAQALEPQALEEALRGPPGGPPARLVALGRVRARRGDRAGAAEALREALVLEPGFAPARSALGALLLGAELDPSLRPAHAELLRALACPELTWSCRGCTHAAQVPLVQCPRCHAWDSFARGAPTPPRN